ADDETVWVPADGGFPAELVDWLAGAAPKHVYDSKRASKALAAAGLELAGVEVDVAIAAWLLRPNQKAESLGSLVYYYLGEHLPQPDPNQLVPETEPLSPASEAWYVR